MKLTSVGE